MKVTEMETNSLEELKKCVNRDGFWDNKEESVRTVYYYAKSLKEQAVANFYRRYFAILMAKAEKVLKGSDKKLVSLGNIQDLEGYADLSYQAKECLQDKFKENLFDGSIYLYGYRICYDLESHGLSAKDEHLADVCISDENNRPVATVTFVKDVLSIPYTGYRECLTEDGRIAYKMPAAEFEDFLFDTIPEMKGDRDNLMYASALTRFTSDSIGKWYHFECEDETSKYFVRFTDAMANLYTEHGTDFYRHVANLNSFVNTFSFPADDYHLIEVAWSGVYIDEEITEDEVEFVTRACNPDSAFAKDVKRQYKAFQDEDGGQEVVEALDKKIGTLQNLVDENADINGRIMKWMKRCAGLPEDATKADVHAEEMTYGFDCGFCYFYFKDDESMEIAKNAACYPDGKSMNDGSFSLGLPFECQSVTLQRYQAEEISRIAKEHNIDLGYYTRLD